MKTCREDLDEISALLQARQFHTAGRLSGVCLAGVGMLKRMGETAADAAAVSCYCLRFCDELKLYSKDEQRLFWHGFAEVILGEV